MKKSTIFISFAIMVLCVLYVSSKPFPPFRKESKLNIIGERSESLRVGETEAAQIGAAQAIRTWSEAPLQPPH